MSKKKKRIRNLESRTAYLLGNHEQQMRAIEHELAYLEAMVRHYIALYEQNKTTTTPTIVPSQEWPVPIPPGGLNIPYPYPFDTTTGTTLHDMSVLTPSQQAARDAAELIDTAPLDEIMKCASAFEELDNEYGYGWDDDADKVRAWVQRVIDHSTVKAIAAEGDGR